jgi:hypothetical protein
MSKGMIGKIVADVAYSELEWARVRQVDNRMAEPIEGEP